MAELVSIHDEIEDGQLAAMETKLSYIGLHYEKKAWKWLDGSPLDYENWDEGQPEREDGQCATLKQNKLWKSQGCDVKSNFHCKLTACKHNQ